jgi:hypothetical protein
VWFRKKPKPDPGEVVRLLRMQALDRAPDTLGLAPSADHPRAWSILMETGYPKAVATLLAVMDGTTSLYFSSGGGVIGAGAHQPVRAALGPFFAAAERHLDVFEAARETPLPEPGRVRFYLRTFDGTLTAEASEQELGSDRHELSPLFRAGHDVLAAVRTSTGG